MTELETPCTKEAADTLCKCYEYHVRIDQRYGCNACTLISARIRHKFLVSHRSLQEFSCDKGDLLISIRVGNGTHDEVLRTGFETAEDAIRLQPLLRLSVSEDVYIKPGEWRLFEERLLHYANEILVLPLY